MFCAVVFTPVLLGVFVSDYQYVIMEVYILYI